MPKYGILFTSTECQMLIINYYSMEGPKSNSKFQIYRKGNVDKYCLKHRYEYFYIHLFRYPSYKFIYKEVYEIDEVQAEKIKAKNLCILTNERVQFVPCDYKIDNKELRQANQDSNCVSILAIVHLVKNNEHQS